MSGTFGLPRPLDAVVDTAGATLGATAGVDVGATAGATVNGGVTFEVSGATGVDGDVIFEADAEVDATVGSDVVVEGSSAAFLLVGLLCFPFFTTDEANIFVNRKSHPFKPQLNCTIASICTPRLLEHLNPYAYKEPLLATANVQKCGCMLHESSPTVVSFT